MTSPADLADKVEKQLKLHTDLATDFRMVMEPDAAWAFVGLLRSTDNLLEEVRRLKAERLKLDRRIRNQRLSLRLNWEIIEMRASYRRAWYPSPLLRSMILNRRKNPPWWRRMMTRALEGISANAQFRRAR